MFHFKRLLQLIPGLCLLLLTSHALSQNIPQIDSFFSIRYAGQFNGGLLMAENGRVLYMKGFGKAEFSTAISNKPDTRFNLASVSKTFTSVAVLQLADRGKIKLEHPVAKYLSNFPYPTITIRHLLTHTSGLPNLEVYEEIVKQFPDTVIDNKSIIPALKNWSKPLPFQPGDKWQYSNTNFDLLAVLVEEVSGISFIQYLRKFVFERAGMRETSVMPGPARNGVATPHVYRTWYTNSYVPTDSIPRYKYINYNLSGLIGSTNIISTLTDMLKFDKALFSGKLLKKETLELALTPVKLNDGTIFYEGSMDTMLGEGKGSYGLGWSIFEQPGFGKSAGHGGFNYGLATFYFHNVAKNQVIIAYDNTAGPAFGKVITSALYLLNGKKGIEKINRISLTRIYGTALKEKGVDEAIVIFNSLKADTLHYYISEREMNWLGYDLLRSGFVEQATEAFKINTVLFPNSFNVYDSFAEALLQSGKKEEAIIMYQKSLSINPENKGAKEALQRLGKP